MLRRRIMILFGHRFIKSEKFYHVDSIESILKTPPNSLIYITFKEEELDIINHCIEQDIRFALHVNNITELIYAENFSASYITIDAILAKDAQQIADKYLFDAKILVHAIDEGEIQEFAYQGMDGVIFSDAIIKITS